MNDIIKQSESELHEQWWAEYHLLSASSTNEEIENWWVSKMKSQMELAYKKGVADVKKHLQVQCLDYCEQQNGLDHCKNCGLSIELIDSMK